MRKRLPFDSPAFPVDYRRALQRDHSDTVNKTEATEFRE
jgi:hypothetical protein